MKKIIYLHGFSSAGSTGTATELRNHFYPLGIEVLSPDIPVMPRDAVPFLKNYIQENLGNPTAAADSIIIGTSMGAMYAELQRGYRRILVNPSFQMSRTLTFMHLGKNVQFQNPRRDGATQFKVDREMTAQFKALETPVKKGRDLNPEYLGQRVLQGITAEEQQLVWGLFGLRDRTVNFQKEFQQQYATGAAAPAPAATDRHFQTFDGEHRLNSQILKKNVIPLIEKIMSQG